MCVVFRLFCLSVLGVGRKVLSEGERAGGRWRAGRRGREGAGVGQGEVQVLVLLDSGSGKGWQESCSLRVLIDTKRRI